MKLSSKQLAPTELVQVYYGILSKTRLKELKASYQMIATIEANLKNHGVRNCIKWLDESLRITQAYMAGNPVEVCDFSKTPTFIGL